MSFSTVMGRVHEIQARAAALAPLPTAPGLGFEQVLQTAQNRFSNSPQAMLQAAQMQAQGLGQTPGPTATFGATAGPAGSAMRTASGLRFPAGFALPAVGAQATTPVPAQLKPMFAQAAQRYGLPQPLLEGLARAESGFRTDAGSPAGAQGVMQLMPATARGLGVDRITDPAQNIDAGARYLRQQLDRFDGDVTLALAAYNAGPGAVHKFGGIPPYAETQAYVPRVLQYARAYGLEVPVR